MKNIETKVVFAAVLSAGLTGLAHADIEAKAVWAGWHKASKTLSGMAGYELHGTQTKCIDAEFCANFSKMQLGSPAPVQHMEWSALVSQSTYNISWTDGSPTGDRHAQAFDGSKWTGFSSYGGSSFGLMSSEAADSSGARWEDNFMERAAGSFYPRLVDIVDKPMNFGIRSLLDKYEFNCSVVRVSGEKDTVSLDIAPEKARELGLPDHLSLRAFSEGLYPVSGTMTYPGGSQLVTFEDFQPLGNAHYPTKIDYKIWKEDGNSKKLVMESNFHLHAILRHDIKVADLRIAFPKGTRLMNDQTKKVTYVGAR